MADVRRILNFEHSELNQPNMSEQYTPIQLEEYKRISDANDNFRLYRLKKVDQQKICIHYGISKLGTKTIIEKRIVDHRDENIEFREFTELEKKKIYSTYNIIGNRTTRNTSNSIKNKVPKDSKINLVVLYHKLKTISARGTGHNLRELYNLYSVREKSRIIRKINSIMNTINEQVNEQVNIDIQNRQARNLQLERNIAERDRLIMERERERERVELSRRNMKRVNIQNLTEQNVHVYWTDIREDAPDYSNCKKLFTLSVGGANDLLYVKDTTKIIVSKVELNVECYYLDIKDHILNEISTGETNGIYEIKEDKRELEQWKEAALKCDFLIKQLKRFGIDKNDNYASIVDLHEDIVIPEHSERDKELAGIPSVFTNVT